MRGKPRILLLAAVLLSKEVSADAQQTGNVPRIGYLSRGYIPTAENPDLKAEAFRQGLRDLGYIDGRNVVIEFLYAEGKGERFPSFLDGLLQRKVDVIVSGTIQAIRAAKQATKRTPIVFITQGDPVNDGLVDGLARPGGNITGLTRFTRELNGKRLELLKEAVPRIVRVAVLQDADSTGVNFTDSEAVANALKLQLQFLEVRDPKHDLITAFQVANKRGANGMLVMSSPVLDRSAKWIAELAIKNRLPSMNEESHWVEAGGLLSYAASDSENFRRAAVYVDKILKGTKPADIPVEQPMKFEFVINLKTAKQIGLTIPQWTLMKADKVIQ